MAATYSAGQTSEAWGFPSPESGILIESLSESITNPKEFLIDESGSRKGFAYDIHSQSDVSVSEFWDRVFCFGNSLEGMEIANTAGGRAQAKHEDGGCSTWFWLGRALW